MASPKSRHFVQRASQIIFFERWFFILADLLTQLGLVVTAVLNWAGNVATTIIETPLLLVTTGVLMLGAAIGIFGRLLSKN